MAGGSGAWRETCHRLLARQPALYAGALRLLRSPDLGKRIFVALVRRGDVVLDVGANRGAYTALFSRLAGPAGRVHAFEPVPPTCDALAASLAAQGIANVVVNRAALGEAPGELPLYVPGDDFGQAALARHGAGSWSTATAVRNYRASIETLDGYARRRGLARIDFVKCDVEGAELAVLRGAGETLRTLAPLLYLEVCADWMTSFGYAPPGVVEHLRAFGYADFYLVRNAGGIRRIEDPAAELAPERLRGSADLLCAHPAHRARLGGLASLAGGLRWS